jgi:hypothetical protein
MPKPKGKASIYKGTDKTTNKRDAQSPVGAPLRYADGSKYKFVNTEAGRQDEFGYTRSSKKGNVITTKLNTTERQEYGPQAGWGLSRSRTKVTTLGKGGRRESVVQRGSMGQVMSETQLNRGSGTRKTGAKKKAY